MCRPFKTSRYVTCLLFIVGLKKSKRLVIILYEQQSVGITHIRVLCILLNYFVEHV